MASPRIAPLDPPYPPDTAALLAKWMPPGADVEPLRLFRTLAVHEELASRMRPLGAGLLGHPRLEPRERELVILRTCARAGAEYEWGVHVRAFAGAVGLSEAQIDATAREDGGGEVLSPQDSQLLAAADALYETDTIPEGLWQQLAERLDSAQLLELVVLAGWYRLISYVINALGVESEPWAARFPSSAGAVTPGALPSSR